MRKKEQRRSGDDRRCGKEEEKKIDKEQWKRCFICGGFGHITHYYRNREEEGSVSMFSNIFEVLKNKVMQRGEDSRKEKEKDRRKILWEEKLKREVRRSKENRSREK